MVKNTEGEWLAGRTFKFLSTSMNEAECRALLGGLRWAKEKGWKQILVYSDAENPIKWIKGAENPRGPSGKLIRDCRSTLKDSSVVRIEHVFHEQNEVADRLAKMAKGSRKGWEEWASPPNEVFRAFQEDNRGIPRVRKVPT